MRYVTFFTLICVLLCSQFLPAQAPDTLWTRLYGNGVGYSVIETSDSGYVIVGYTAYGWLLWGGGGGDGKGIVDREGEGLRNRLSGAGDLDREVARASR